MSDVTPNPKQQKLISNTEGIYVVDAGPGTGKTFTITRRYVEIVGQAGVEPDDILLVTFTNSAATEMRDRIVAESTEYGMQELADAPIQTFHSHCSTLLQEHGHAAPTHLGIDDRITSSTRLIEEEMVEQDLFREFISQFRDEHPEYADYFRAVSDPVELLDVIKQLAAKGVFPTADGWYRDGESHLDGDFEAFKSKFDAVNEPRNGGSKQSKLRDKLSRYGSRRTFLPDAPSKTEIRGGRGTKQLNEQVAERVFNDDRTELKAFLRELYHEYLTFALSRNYLNFGFLQLFAFVLLCENDSLRDAVSFEYVMIDEFQDSSEIQFKLALLLAGTDNFCVVGDWKQSIYSFQYAAVENIQHFDDRIEQFTAELNSDRQRVSLNLDAIEPIKLEENYRSTDSIIRFSEQALVTPATDKDSVDEGLLEEVVELQSNAAFDNSNIEAIAHEDEYAAVLSKIQAIEGSDEYAVEDEDGEPRPPRYEDIAVLTRTRDFGRELLNLAEEHDFPLSYEGGVELFRTDAAKLLLAWLRILEYDANRGWAVVLEEAGYTLDTIDHLLETDTYPDNMTSFRDELAGFDAVGTVARRVFEKYGFRGGYADVLLDMIQSLHDTTTLTRGYLIRFIEQGIESGSTHEVSTSASDDSVTVQTIHSAKGLEYPIVIVADMNDGRFPPQLNDSSVIRYNEAVGLRQRKVYGDIGEYPHVYDKWQYDIYRHCLGTDYDEERRLLYVAITRAENHVCLVGGETPNMFLEELPPEITEAATDIGEVDRGDTAQSQLPFIVSTPEGPTGYSPHSLMDEDIFEEEDGVDTGDTRGTAFGSEVHDFAEDYALGEAVRPLNPDEEAIKAFLDGLDGKCYVEESAVLPLEVDGGRVTISGIADLVHVTDDYIEIVDYKTDQTRRAHEEYRKQLSVYYHVLDAEYPDRKVIPTIFYTTDAEQVTIDPLSTTELQSLVRTL